MPPGRPSSLTQPRWDHSQPWCPGPSGRQGLGQVPAARVGGAANFRRSLLQDVRAALPGTRLAQQAARRKFDADLAKWVQLA